MGVLDDKRLQLGNERRLPAKREIGVDAVFKGAQPQLLEASAVDARERLVELRKRLTAPERESLAQASRRGLGIEMPSRREQLLEAQEVDRLRIDLDHEPPGPCLK